MESVLIIAPNIGMGGVERASCTMANAFASHGHKVLFLALIPELPFFKLSSDIQYIEPIGFNSKKMDILRTLLFIRNEVHVYKPNYILAYTKFYAAIANLALIGSHYGLVLTERSSPLYKWPWYIELFCWISFRIKQPRGVISQTSVASEYHRRYYPGVPNVVIPNPVRNVIKYPYLLRKNWILAVGRFHDDNKGFDLLVQAFSLMQNKTWRLVFVGGSRDDGKYLLDISANSQVASRLDFLGKVIGIDEIYAQAGIFVMPSRKEGFPNALCEAMAAGCACISFDFIAGPRDIISNLENGIIVPDRDIQGLADALDHLILNSKLRIELGKSAEITEQRLSLDKIAQQYWNFLLKVYSSVVS